MTDVVILPGLDGTGRLLADFCTTLDALGVAARAMSYPVDQSLGYAELEGIVRPQLPASPFVLVGESFSGPLAIRIAARPPVGLVGLVLSTSFARAPVPALAPFAPLVRFTPARPPLALLSWWLLGEWSSPALRTELRQALRWVEPAVLRRRAMSALRDDVSALLPSVRLPALQLVATNDRLLSGSASRAVADGLPQCRTVTVRGPHLLLQAAVDRCAREVAAFAMQVGSNALPALQPQFNSG